jgi:hypothetical protein
MVFDGQRLRDVHIRNPMKKQPLPWRIDSVDSITLPDETEAVYERISSSKDAK